jgi:nitronate monooxygenase
MHWSNGFLSRFGIRLPIIQAPMGGGSSTPELVAAVCNAGALGSFAAAYIEPGQIETAIDSIRNRTSAPFAVNLFAPSTPGDASAHADSVLSFLVRFHQELGLAPPSLPSQAEQPFSDQAEVLLHQRVPIVSFTLGMFPPELVQRFKANGSFVIGTATTVKEALLLEESGVDALVAQGSEAGGHRGTFANTVSEGLVGTMALVPQMVDAVRIPVIASGGIMDGRGIVAALALGAGAVQMGTAFLTCAESGVAEVYKAALMAASEEQTVVTRAFSGRWARAVRNRFIDESERAGIEPIPFPWQNALTAGLRRAAAAQNRADLLSLYAGQGLRMLRRIPVAELIANLESEMAECIAQLARIEAPEVR